MNANKIPESKKYKTWILRGFELTCTNWDALPEVKDFQSFVVGGFSIAFFHFGNKVHRETKHLYAKLLGQLYSRKKSKEYENNYKTISRQHALLQQK